MRQVVVLEPAGSVLVIRQTSLGNNGGNVGTNSTGTNDTHALVNHAAVPTIASNDHNQNRIVVVRSSTSSTCMTNSVRTQHDFCTCIINEPQVVDWFSLFGKVLVYVYFLFTFVYFVAKYGF